MKQVVLDTNFIISCIRNKIDFLEDIFLMGFEILIPKQVLAELQRIVSSNKQLKLREEAELSLKILQNEKLKKIDLKETYVDKGLIKYLKHNPEVFLATLDKELQKKVKNSKIIIRGKKKLELR